MQHVMVFLPFVSVGFPPGCQEKEYCNPSHSRPRDIADGESSTNSTCEQVPSAWTQTRTSRVEGTMPVAVQTSM